MLRFVKSRAFLADFESAFGDDQLHSQTRKIWPLLEILRAKQPIPPEYKAHKLRGDWVGWWDCHLSGDFILIWRYREVLAANGCVAEEVVDLARVGTHRYLGL